MRMERVSKGHLAGDKVLLLVKVLWTKSVWATPQKKIYAESLTPDVTVFGDSISVEVIKVNCGHKGRTLIQ